MKKNVGLIIAIVIVLALVALAFYGNLIGNKHHKATIEMEDGSKIVVELYQEVAPKTVDNFVKLANSGFYDGLTFHRIIKDFMIQGGDPNGNGTGGSNKTIEGEFSENGFVNNLSHKEGTISMARGDDKNSASSQFFITTADRTDLDGKYAAFGRVIEGMDVVNNLENIEVQEAENGEKSKPVNAPRIKTITIDKYSITIENKIDTTQNSNQMATDDSNVISIEDLYYSMYEQEGYTVNADKTLTSPDGKTYTLEELLNEDSYKMLENDGYKRNEDNSLTSPSGEKLTLEEALEEAYPSTDVVTEETTADTTVTEE